MFFFKSASHAYYEKIFYDFKINSISGDIIDLNDFKGKPVLIVNTASIPLGENGKTNMLKLSYIE